MEILPEISTFCLVLSHSGGQQKGVHFADVPIPHLGELCVVMKYVHETGLLVFGSCGRSVEPFGLGS